MTPRKNLDPTDLVTIAEAARLLSVSMPAQRRRDSSGKFPGRSNPMIAYRMYAKDDVLPLRRRIVQGERTT